ncbi:hypothetical protein D3C85_1098650 [compost metagenome]
MELSHVPHVRNHRNIVLTTKQTYRNKLTYPSYSYCICLYKSSRSGLQIVFENDTVRHMFSQSQFYRSNGICQFLMSQYIIRVSGFFYPIGIHTLKFSTYFQCLRECPLLIRIQHDFNLISGFLPYNMRSANVSLWIFTSYF